MERETLAVLSRIIVRTMPLHDESSYILKPFNPLRMPMSMG